MDRFWQKVDVRSPSECWEWRGYKNRHGYGRYCSLRFSSRSAHRIAYELGYGKSPGKLCVCHRCDNPGCVNPLHLFLGTQADNNLDARSKGRNRGHRLTENEVLEVKRLLAEGNLRQYEIAARFGVSPSTISSIHCNKRRLKDRLASRKLMRYINKKNL